jgi:hypothetical protein
MVAELGNDSNSANNSISSMSRAAGVSNSRSFPSYSGVAPSLRMETKAGPLRTAPSVGGTIGSHPPRSCFDRGSATNNFMYIYTRERDCVPWLRRTFASGLRSPRRPQIARQPAGLKHRLQYRQAHVHEGPSIGPTLSSGLWPGWIIGWRRSTEKRHGMQGAGLLIQLRVFSVHIS